MTGPEIAIVGGGIVGVSVAYHLGRRTDDPITVYERGELASETTFKSTAMIGVAGPDPYHRMKGYGFRLYNRFFADPRGNTRYRGVGRLRVTTSTGTAAELAELASGDRVRTEVESGDLTAAKFANTPVDFVPGDELHERVLVPPLDTDIVEGALYRPQYGYITSDSRTLGARELAVEFIERARDSGVTFETNTEVTDVIVEGDSVTGIETDGAGVVDVGTVVCAAGPWNTRLVESAGLDVPVEHRLSPVFSLELDEPFPYTMPAIKSHESSVGLHPKSDDRVLVTYTPDDNEGKSRYDPASVGESELGNYREAAIRPAERLMPALVDADLVDEWVGVGIRTPDGKPIVGWTAIDGLSLAATPSGIQYAPAVGSIVARQLAEGKPTEYYDSVSISRFDGHTGRRT